MTNLKIVIISVLIFLSTSLFAQNYVYLDGSANKYEFIGDGLAYIPMTPEKSSSGEYSGGEPKKVGVSSDEMKLLKAAFKKAIKAKDEQQENRAMMTGMIIREKPSKGWSASGRKKKSKTIILKPDSVAKKELEELLKKIISK